MSQNRSPRKDVPPEQFLAAVHVVARGDALLDPSITRTVIEEFANRPALRRELVARLEELTAREREVFAWSTAAFRTQRSLVSWW